MFKKLFVFFIAVLNLQSFAQRPLISATDFAVEVKTSKSLVVIDVNTPEVYARQHIQGAINLYFKDLYKTGAVEGQLKPNEELVNLLGNKGISDKSKIVVYDDGSNKHNSRVWWILKSLGAQDAYILHFNTAELAATGIQLTATPSIGKATTFILSESSYKSLAMADVQKMAEGTLLLDGREKDEFDGVDSARKSRGHIPGAVWMNYKEVLTATGAYKSKDEIIAAAAKFGAATEKPIVVYCNSGVKASVMYVAFKEIAGFRNVQYYAGSYAEWVSVPENPIVK